MLGYHDKITDKKTTIGTTRNNVPKTKKTLYGRNKHMVLIWNTFGKFLRFLFINEAHAKLELQQLLCWNAVLLLSVCHARASYGFFSSLEGVIVSCDVRTTFGFFSSKRELLFLVILERFLVS